MTLEEFQNEIEQKLMRTDFYDNIIMFCGPRGSETYDKVCSSIAEAIVRGYEQGESTDSVAMVLLKANNMSVERCLFSVEDLKKN